MKATDETTHFLFSAEPQGLSRILRFTSQSGASLLGNGARQVTRTSKREGKS